MLGTAVTASGSERVRMLVEGALCVALTLVLSHLKVFRMPQGGSITLEMAPLLFYAYRRGSKWGMSAGALSGFLQMLLGGYIVHPLQAALDYPLAFAAVGMAGFAKNADYSVILYTFCAGAARFLCHVASGAAFFGSYAPAGKNPWVYSAAYNATFMIPSLIICGVVAFLLWRKLGKGTGCAR